MAARKPKRITSIKEIAKLADCSIATVSNALNNKGRISQQVRDRIFKYAGNTVTSQIPPEGIFAAARMKRSG